MSGGMAWFRHLPILSASFHRLDRAILTLFDYIDQNIDQVIERREKEHEKGHITEPKCFVEAFLNEIERAEEDRKEGQLYFWYANI